MMKYLKNNPLLTNDEGVKLMGFYFIVISLDTISVLHAELIRTIEKTKKPFMVILTMFDVYYNKIKRRDNYSDENIKQDLISKKNKLGISDMNLISIVCLGNSYDIQYSAFSCLNTEQLKKTSI